MSMIRTNIKDGWRWRLFDANNNKTAKSHTALRDWTAVVSFPSVIHTELLAQNLIPDPYVGENERLVQWVGESDWTYSCSFSTPVGVSTRRHVDLVLKGLDTFATVFLNGVLILESDNMFIPHRISVAKHLHHDTENELTIIFRSAIKAADELEKLHGPRTSLMRDRRRMHTRKAQYHWGWDWGPVLLTAGPYLPIELEVYDTRIEHVHVVPELKDDHTSASVSIDVAVAYPQASSFIHVDINDAAGVSVASMKIPTAEASHETQVYHCSACISYPKLWWPNGHGDQHLYTVRTKLVDQSGQHTQEQLDHTTTSIGIRSIKLVQRPLVSVPGTTFMFRVNGRDIFIQGGNWIPADMLLPTISRKRYFDWVRLAQQCHLNMIRVWGGGIYETDDFLDACDAMGVLVWHDYALACGDYPTNDAFVASVTREAELQTIRLRNRACLALLCGGNEDFMFADLLQKYFLISFGFFSTILGLRLTFRIEYDRTDLSGPFDNKPFPQRKLYLQILPTVAKSFCPNVPYWANSPFGGSDANDATVGDIHQWNVWHGDELPYQDYKTIGGRFVSEFGMHGFPVDRTVDYFCKNANKHQRHAQSQLIDCHNKSEGAHTRIARYLAENFRFDMTSLANFSYASQLMQSEAYVYALQHWRRHFRGPGREECAGAIIWQLNDVYPCTSWAFVDYFLRPKPSYYSIKRAFALFSVGIERSISTRWIDENKLDESKGPPSFQLWAQNTASSTDEKHTCQLVLEAYDLSMGAWLPLPESDRAKLVVLGSGHTTELGLLEAPATWTESTLVVLEARIVHKETEKTLARYVDWPEPYRYLNWPSDTKLAIEVVGGGEGFWESHVTVSSNFPLKGVWLEPVYDGTEAEDGPEPVWEDNMFDLMPDRAITVGVNGLGVRGVKGRFLADWEIKSET